MTKITVTGDNVALSDGITTSRYKGIGSGGVSSLTELIDHYTNYGGTSTYTFTKGTDFANYSAGGTAAPAVWIDHGNSDLSQEDMSWTYSSKYHYASLANNNLMGTEPSVFSIYPFAHSNSGNKNIGILIDLQLSLIHI